MEVVTNNYMPGDSRLIQQLVYELKSQGIFDQFRKECIADVDTKPAYQNLRQRVEGSVTSFLKQQTWRPDMNKNQVREQLRKSIYECGYLETGVERIVDQVVNPKINTVFLPQVEDVVYRYLGIEKPSRSEVKKELKIDVTDLLPTDLEAVSPESDHTDRRDDSFNLSDSLNVGMRTEEDESPAFEPLDVQQNFVQHEENSVDSHLSGFSGLQSHDSNPCTETKLAELSNQDSQVSQNSSESYLSIITSEENTKMEICEDSESKVVECSDSEPKLEIPIETPLIPEKQSPRKDLEDTKKDTEDVKKDEKAELDKKDEKKPEERKSEDKKKRDDKKRNEETRKHERKSDDKRSKSSDKRSSSKDKRDAKKDDKHKKSSSSGSSSRDKEKSSSKHSSSSSGKDKDKSKDKKDMKSSSVKERDKGEKPRSERDKTKDKKDAKSKSSSDKDIKDKSEKDKEKSDKDKSKSSTSSSNKHSSSSSSNSKEKEKSVKKESSSKDREKSRSSSSSAAKDGESKSKSSSDLHKRSDKPSHNAKHSSSSSSSKKDKDRKRDSKKEPKDDHYSAKEKKNHRRSTDRDSNDGQSSRQSHSTSISGSSSSSSQKTVQESSNSISGSGGSGDSGGSDQVDRSAGKSSESIEKDEVMIPCVDVQKLRYIKPKFASNFQEARKLMKIRRQLARLERQNQLSLAHIEVAAELPVVNGLSYDEADSGDEVEAKEAGVEEKKGGTASPKDAQPVLQSTDLSKESWEALEARLAQEMSNVNYNSYESPYDDYDCAGYNSIVISPRKNMKEAKAANVVERPKTDETVECAPSEKVYDELREPTKEDAVVQIDIISHTMDESKSITDQDEDMLCGNSEEVVVQSISQEVVVQNAPETNKPILVVNMEKLSMNKEKQVLEEEKRLPARHPTKLDVNVIHKNEAKVEMEQCRYLERPSPSLERHLQFIYRYVGQLERDIKRSVKNPPQNNCLFKKRGRKRKLQENVDVKNNNKAHYEQTTETKKRRRSLAPNPNSLISKANKDKMCNNTDISPNDRFSLPLSPAESDKSSDKKEEESPKSAKQKRNTIVKNTTARSQRYSSDDLYKPRPMIASSRRSRGAKNLGN